MADISDVTATLAQMAAAALYPNGAADPSAVGATVTIAPGWPQPKQVDAAMAAGAAMFTVYPVPGLDVNTSRFLNEDPEPTATPVPELTLTVNGADVTVGGTIKAGEAAFLGVDYAPHTYQVLATDTLDSVAAALAALIAGATVNGATITLPAGTFDIQAGVSAVASLATEVGRQQRMFMLTAWAPTVALRDSISAAVDVYLKSIAGRRITLADGSIGILIYRGTRELDTLGTRNCYRRDLNYQVEYPTVVDSTSNTITNLQTTLTLNGTAPVTTLIP